MEVLALVRTEYEHGGLFPSGSPHRLPVPVWICVREKGVTVLDIQAWEGLRGKPGMENGDSVVGGVRDGVCRRWPGLVPGYGSLESSSV